MLTTPTPSSWMPAFAGMTIIDQQRPLNIDLCSVTRPTAAPGSLAAFTAPTPSSTRQLVKLYPLDFLKTQITRSASLRLAHQMINHEPPRTARTPLTSHLGHSSTRPS